MPDLLPKAATFGPTGYSVASFLPAGAAAASAVAYAGWLTAERESSGEPVLCDDCFESQAVPTAAVVATNRATGGSVSIAIASEGCSSRPVRGVAGR